MWLNFYFYCYQTFRCRSTSVVLRTALINRPQSLWRNLNLKTIYIGPGTVAGRAFPDSGTGKSRRQTVRHYFCKKRLSKPAPVKKSSIFQIISWFSVWSMVVERPIQMSRKSRSFSNFGPQKLRTWNFTFWAEKKLFSIFFRNRTICVSAFSFEDFGGYRRIFSGSARNF